MSFKKGKHPIENLTNFMQDQIFLETAQSFKAQRPYVIEINKLPNI